MRADSSSGPPNACTAPPAAIAPAISRFCSGLSPATTITRLESIPARDLIASHGNSRTSALLSIRIWLPVVPSATGEHTMVRVDITPLEVHSSAERAFELISDLRHEPEWNPDTLGAQVEGAIGVGTVFH